MSWSTTGRNQRAEATAGLIVSVSLHTADPGAAGTDNEVSGSGYARQAPSWGSASNGVVNLSAALAYTGPASTTAAHAGLWGTGPTFLGSVARTGGDAQFNAEGEYNITSMAIDAQGNIS